MAQQFTTKIDLSPHDLADLRGENGPLRQFALSLVVRAAEIWRAPHLIDASFAHIDACHYTGQAHLDFARYLQDCQAKFPIPVWTNTLPVSLDKSDGRGAIQPAFVAEAQEVATIY